MKIALDVMGGDNAPIETVKGAIFSLKEVKNLEVVLVGKEELIKKELEKYTYDKSRIEVKNATEEILMHETMPPTMAVRKKKDASMNIALELVKNSEAKACVSAGNTGALMTASQLKLKRIKGVLRPAITAVFPNKKGNMIILDAGANADCKAEYLEQFAVMGSYYAKALLNKENPRIGLLNIGEEPGKGNELTKETYELLKETKNINFVGNIESREMMDGEVDVVVTDGFTGNIVLKAGEGVASFVIHLLKESLKEGSIINKIGALLMKGVFKNLKKRLDYSEFGGALFLGLNGISIKSHGSSDANAIKNAIKVAHSFAEKDFVKNLSAVMKGEVECQK